MGPQSLTDWKLSALLLAGLAAWILGTIVFEHLTGLDGFRWTGYAVTAIGLGILAWARKQAGDGMRYLQGVMVTGLGAAMVLTTILYPRVI